MVENWQCQTCKLCMDKPFVEEHARLTGHNNIEKKDVWKVVYDQIDGFENIPNLSSGESSHD